MGRISYSKPASAIELGSADRPAASATGLVANALFVDRSSLLEFISNELNDLEIERLDGLFFDRKGKFIGRYIVSSGTIDQVWISSRALMSLCIELKASTFILAHNHTNGCAWPSFEDIESTRSVERASDVLGFHFLDHFVVADGACVSMRSGGCFRYRCPSYAVRPMSIILERVSLLLTPKGKRYLTSVTTTGALPKEAMVSDESDKMDIVQ